MSKLNLTKNQSLVFEALTHAEGPLSAYTILDKLRDHGFRAPLQVYRALEKLLEMSHDLHVVMAETDTVICLNGHVCCRGTPQAVSQSPEYLKLFGTRAAQTLAVYSHDHDHTHLPDGRVLHNDGSVTDHCHKDDGHHHEHTEACGHDHNHGPGCSHDHHDHDHHDHNHGHDHPAPVDAKGHRHAG